MAEQVMDIITYNSFRWDPTGTAAKFLSKGGPVVLVHGHDIVGLLVVPESGHTTRDFVRERDRMEPYPKRFERPFGHSLRSFRGESGLVILENVVAGKELLVFANNYRLPTSESMVAAWVAPDFVSDFLEANPEALEDWVPPVPVPGWPTR